MKKLLIFAVLIVAIGGYFIFSKPASQSMVTPTPTPTPTPQVSPVSASVTPKAGSFTLAQVAQHATEADCYTAIDGAVYDLTAFVTKHPGGDRAIFKICGIDGSKAFNQQHGGQQKQLELLATFKIGVLTQ